MKEQKNPLYRKINTKSLSTRYWVEGKPKYKHDKLKYEREGLMVIPIKRRRVHGCNWGNFNYNPLFRFLHSKVGSNWDEIYSECCDRLLYREPVWVLVDRYYKGYDTVRFGENNYWDKLYINEYGILCNYPKPK